MMLFHSSARYRSIKMRETRKWKLERSPRLIFAKGSETGHAFRKIVTTPARACYRSPAVPRAPGTTAGEDVSSEPSSGRLDPRTPQARPYHLATQPAQTSHNLCRLGAPST